MSTLNRPEDLSDNAWIIIQAIYKNYSDNDSKYFEKFELEQFNFSYEELDLYCEELQDKRYLFWEYPHTDSMYLYMLPKILSYVKNPKY